MRCSALFILLITGCNFFDIINTESLEITGFTPDSKFINTADLHGISITFSRIPDLTLAEEAFTLTDDGLPSYGEFAWSGSTMMFQPYAGWKNGVQYEMKVETSVEDFRGRSLSQDFVHSFTTRSEETRPFIVSSTPGDGTGTSQLRPRITVRFSEPMDVGTVAESLSIYPDMDGILLWDSAGELFSYILTEDLDWQTEYEVTVTDRAADAQNNSLAEEWTCKFYIGTDLINPSLLSLSTTGSSRTAVQDSLEDSVLTVTPDWETHWPVVLNFSESMNTESFQGNLNISPGINWIENWNTNSTLLTLTPDPEFSWDTAYTIVIETGITDIQGNSLDTEYHFTLRTNGPGSKPPEVAAVALYTDPADSGSAVIPTPYSAVSFANFIAPPGSRFSGNSIIDVFLDMADGAIPDVLSLAENFRVRRGGVREFHILAAARKDAAFNPPNFGTTEFDPADPKTAYNDWVRFIVYIDNNDSSATGIMTLTITGEFTDSSGRKMGKDWTMPVLITD